MTPTERESIYPVEVVEAWHWLDINCRHWATVGQDQQTTANLSADDREIAEQHLQTLRDAGLIEHERGFRGNFVKKPL